MRHAFRFTPAFSFAPIFERTSQALKRGPERARQRISPLGDRPGQPRFRLAGQARVSWRLEISLVGRVAVRPWDFTAAHRPAHPVKPSLREDVQFRACTAQQPGLPPDRGLPWFYREFPASVMKPDRRTQPTGQSSDPIHLSRHLRCAAR